MERKYSERDISHGGGVYKLSAIGTAFVRSSYCLNAIMV